ncbi:MAG: CRTAC1 family protein [Planctomycetales bacterium]|nr:CRTAC1 family protein [Planctomycetales bacterium]
MDTTPDFTIRHLSQWAGWTISLLLVMLTGCHRGDDGKQLPKPELGKISPEVDETFFTDVTHKVDLNFTHHAGGGTQFYFPSVMSPGAAWVDYDRDGDLDLLLTDGWLASEQTHPNRGPDPLVRPSSVPIMSTRITRPGSSGPGGPDHLACRLYRQDASGEFADVTLETGLQHFGFGMGLAIGDVNNDGFPDIYLTCVGPDRLFLNQNGESFSDVSEAANIDNARWGTSATFLDYDRDGWLDLFVTNYVDYDPSQPCITANGLQDFCNPAIFPRTAAKLYRNVTASLARDAGDQGTPRTVAFQDVSVDSGIASQAGAGLGVTCGDFNRDGWVDIYVANDGHDNFLWMNQRDGTFRDEAVLLGAGTDALGRGQGSMGVAVADLNGDRGPDIFVTNLDGEINALYLSQPEGGFKESAAASGLGLPSFSFTGFGTAFLDLEHDGDSDLLVVNGRVKRSTRSGMHVGPMPAEIPEFWRPYVETNHIFLNEGAGRFRLVRGLKDDFASSRGIARALAAGDFDNDGDVDLVVTNTAGAVRLYRNDAAKRGHWFMVRAIDPRFGGRDAIGAEVTLQCGDKQWTGSVHPGSSYLSSHDPRLHFGLGGAAEVDRIDVLWPDGQREQFAGGPTDTLRTVSYGQGNKP